MTINSRFKPKKVRNLAKVKEVRLQTFANRRRVNLALSPTPFKVDKFGGREYLDMDVRLLYLFLVEHLTPENLVPLCEIAKLLDIHRDSASEWLEVLSRQGCVRGGIFWKFGKPFEVEGIRKPFETEKEWLEQNTVNIQAQEYDPWNDRKYDRLFYDPWFPYFIDEVIDKYYDITMDEVHMFTGERRLRPNGQVFKPMNVERHEYDHPIYFHQEIERNKTFKQGTKNHWPAPPSERRGEISERCNAGKRQIRKRISTDVQSKKETLESWLPQEFLEKAKKHSIKNK